LSGATIAPVIDGRDRAAILADLLARVPSYVPEWSAIGASPAYALFSILARDVEIQAAAVNGMPDRARLAFLSMLGNSLLPAEAAGTPLVFQLMANAPMDVTLNAGSQIAARLPPSPPSLLGASSDTADAPLFSTDSTITLTRAALTTVYSVDPNADTYADHSAMLTTSFAFFDAMGPVLHQLYLGHDEMFRLPGSAEIQLSFDLAAAFADSVGRPLLLDWEYLSADGWLPLRIGDDQTARMTQDGKVALWLDFGPDAKRDTINGINSYWIRATVSAGIPSGTVGPLPGGYKISWGPSPTLTLPVAPAKLTVTVDGTHSADIVSVVQSTITLDRSLAGARVGLPLLTFPGGTFVGRIVGSSGGQSLILAGVDQGRTIVVQGAGKSATVLGGDGAVAMLDGFLGVTVTKGAPLPSLVDAESGEPVGSLLALDADFSVPLDSGTEFLAGDVVTVDGSSQATVKAPQGKGAVLSGPINNAMLGNELVLANALPVLRPEGADTSGVLPTIDTIFARVGFTKSDLQPDAAYCENAPLDISNTFYPFGKAPQKFTTFYIASDEVFQRQNAQVVMTFVLAQAGIGFGDNDAPGVGPGGLDVSIEYFNGDGWTALGPAQSLLDGTASLTSGDRTHPTTISFICPANWAACKVGGQAKHWLRMRIDGGNYGHPLRLSVDPGPPPVVNSVPATLTPPVVASIRLQYTFLTNAGLVQHCLTYNDFVFADHSIDVQWPRRVFQPFTPVADRQPAVHFGFSQALPSGLVSLYFAAAPQDGAALPTSSPFVWEYASPRGWVGLSTLDGTDGFAENGFVQFIGPSDASALPGLGGTLTWLRARLKPDFEPTALPGHGLWLNAVEAHQGQTVQNDTLGTSNGNPGQTFAFSPLRVPVLPGETILVREWIGRGDDWQTAVAGVPDADLTKEVDPTDGITVVAVWVTWHLVPVFYNAGPNDRNYMLERATGLLSFPTPPYGMIPPAGALIVASYATGGGLAGNVPAGTITELHSSASYVQSVTNPFPASGGSATEIVTVARDRATQRLRHRGRAVAPADFEWIAREASPQVARARCLATTGPDGERELGWVTLVVVPNSTDAAPLPTDGLLAEVQSALDACVPAAIVGYIRLGPPSYTPLSVRADIVPLVPNQAALVEARVRTALTVFLHPLIGGSDGGGWDFGQPVYQSQLATLLEAIEGVDYVALLQLLVDDGVVGDVATIGPDSLVCQGDHQLKLAVEEG
jgi:hypothetical protein